LNKKKTLKMQGGRDGQKGPAAGNLPTTMPSKLQRFQKTCPPSVKFSSASFLPIESAASQNELPVE
jgi:hypothetical protein